MRKEILLPVLCLAVCLLAGCRCADPHAIAGPDRPGAFTFVVMADPQPWGQVDKLTHSKYFERNIEEINRLDPDFVIVCGDQILGYVGDVKLINAMWDRYDQMVARFNMPVYRVIGNHDTTNETMERVFKGRYGGRFPLYYSFDHANCHFVALDTEVQGADHKIEGDQLAWLKRDLDRNNAEHTFVFMHEPLYDESYIKRGNNWARDVHPLLAGHGVDTVFNGHWHGYRKAETVDGVRHIMTGGGGGGIGSYEALGDFWNYCVVTVRGDDVSIAVVQQGGVHGEDVVRMDSWERYQKTMESAVPLRLRPARGAAEAPGRTTFTATNAFDDTLRMKAEITIPEGSPWRIEPRQVSLELEPGATKDIAYTITCDKPITSPEAMKAVPEFRISGTVGALEIQHQEWLGRKARPRRMTVDTWPYEEGRKPFAQWRRPTIDEAADNIDTRLVMEQENPLDVPVRARVSWVVPEGSKWRLDPADQTVTLPPKSTTEIAVGVTFTGTYRDFLSVPKLDAVFTAGDDEVYSVKGAELRTANIKEFLKTKRSVGSAPCLKAPPVIDGKIDEGEYPAAAAQSAFVGYGGRSIPREPTQAWVAYDARNFYMAFRCTEPGMDKLKALAGPDSKARVYKDDCLELYIDAKADRLEGSTQRIAISCNGWPNADLAPDAKWQRAAGKEKDAWIIEVAIPWSALGIDPAVIKPGKQVILQMCRSRRVAPGEYSTWSPTPGSYFNVPYFGTLTLAD